MLVVEVHDSFGLENLRLATRPDPRYGDREVLVKMAGSSLNARDYLVVTGSYDTRQTLPLIPCSDGAGTVEAVGRHVERLSVGDRVMPCFAQGWLDGPLTSTFRRTSLGGPLDGTLAEYMVLSEDGLVRTPRYLSDIEASTLPCAALTAWNAVVGQADVHPGDTVLIEGTGGVAVFALQFAVMVGARAIVMSKSDEKLDRARALGAEETINYKRDPAWHETVKDITDGRGADLVIEVGGAATLEQAVRAVKPSGQLSMIGVLGGPVASLTLPLVVMRNVRMQGITVGSRRDLEAMVADVEKHRMRPVVDRVFDVSDVGKAFSYLQEAEHFGKVCIRHSWEEAVAS